MLRLPVLLLSTALSASAQTTGGAALRGVVLESTGAAVTGVKVTASNVETSFVYEGLTSRDGSYHIPYLIPRYYRLTAETFGFIRSASEHYWTVSDSPCLYNQRAAGPRVPPEAHFQNLLNMGT